MSLLAALAKKWNYSVKNPGPGRLLYHEGNREYTFPFYQENGVWVLAAMPSARRVHFFFTWHAEAVEFSGPARSRILARIQEQLRVWGIEIRIFEPIGPDASEFEFYQELMDYRERALESLAAAGCDCFADYSSIDLLPAEYGLEISGIKKQVAVKQMAAALSREFPHWHHQYISRCEHESGWTLAVSLFPARFVSPEWSEGE